MATLQDVLAVAQRRVPVFPLRPGTKDGYLNAASDHGATTDPSTLYDTFSAGNLNFGCWTAGGHVIIDIDAGHGGLEAWNALLAEIGPVGNTFTVRSARGGLHVYFKVDERGELFSSADLVPGKINVRGVNGYVVGPGSTFTDPDTGITGVYSIAVDAPIASLPDNLRQKLRRRSEDKEAGQVVSELDTPDAIRSARNRLSWAEPAIENQGGDNYTYKLACSLLDYGLTVDTCHDLMRELWDYKCVPSWGEELRVKIQNAWNHRQAGIGRDNPSAGFEPMPPHLLRALNTLPELKAADGKRKLLKYAHEASLAAIRERQSRAVVRELIHPGELVLMVGEPGSGKSFLMLDMAYAIAQGREWHGRRTKQAPALYVCCEGAGGFDKRILAATEIYGPPGAHFALLAVPITLNKEASGKDGAETVIEAYRQLAGNAGAQTPGLIIVDTKARATAGDDENSTADTMTFIEQRIGAVAQATGAAVAVVHHPNKVGGTRGSSSLEGAADVIIWAAKGDNGDERFLTSTKVKDGEEGTLFSYGLDIVVLGIDADGVPVTSCVIGAKAKGGLSERQNLCLELTKRMMHMALSKEVRLSPRPKANNNAARWLAENQPAGGGFTKEEFNGALALAPILGLRTSSYVYKGRNCERYEIAPALPDASATHRRADASDAMPMLPATCVGTAESAAQPAI